ncbi:MAG: EFR1 family ferrodoxin [Dehalococcoidales bacterium]|nr:MAG: EFR1 family ferrodoxin [Dehalococcoidales bacterium]
MKSIVIYYTMTGNTKAIAEAIYRGMTESGEQCDIIRLQEAYATNLSEYDLIGLGSPIINQKELPNVTNFIEGMENLDGKHAFAFNTHGASPCRYLARVVPAMEQRGLTVIGWEDWFCSAYYPVIPKPYITDGHPDETDIKEAEEFGKEMVGRSRRIYAGEIGLIPEFPRGKEYDERYNPPELWLSRMPEIFAEYSKVMAEAEFKIDTEKCNYPKCTHCIDNCPVHNIGVSDNGPVFHKSCAMCFLCEQTCPNGAIGIDWEAFQKPHDKLVENWLSKIVDYLEAKGYFRRLIPREEIGWDTPFWKTKNPPRFKIQ